MRLTPQKVTALRMLGVILAILLSPLIVWLSNTGTANDDESTRFVTQLGMGVMAEVTGLLAYITLFEKLTGKSNSHEDEAYSHFFLILASIFYGTVVGPFSDGVMETVLTTWWSLAILAAIIPMIFVGINIVDETTVILLTTNTKAENDV